MTLHKLIERKQPRDISSLIRLVEKSGFMVLKIDFVRYYGSLQGIRIRVRDPQSGATSVLPPKRGYFYTIVK